MARWIKELGAIVLAAAVTAVALPRALLPTAARVAAPERPRVATTDDAIIAAPDAGAVACETPAPVAVEDAPPAARDHHRADPCDVPLVLAQADGAPVPGALSRRDGTWVLDARRLPSMRQVLAGARVVPPGDDGAAEGYRITAIDRAGLMRTAGIRPGDVLVGVGGLPLRNPDEALDALARLRGATRATFVFLRGGSRYSVPVELVGRTARELGLP